MSADRLSSLLERFRLRATLFHTGALCGITRFDAAVGHGWLHVLRAGDLVVHHPAGSDLPARLQFDAPTLLFYPRAVDHQFVNPPREGADFTCAAVRFDDGALHPLARALPPLVALPLAAVPDLDAALALLFAEADRARCGSRLVVDRLFEVVMVQLLRWLVDHPQEAGVQAGLVQALADPRLARALTAVHEAPGEAWTLERLAGIAAMSRSRFAAAFRAAVGTTPGDYITDLRIALAQAALREGRPLARIAAELGYAHPTALTRAFSARAGMPPGRWRRALAVGRD